MKIELRTAVGSVLGAVAALLLLAIGPALAKTRQKTAPPESWAAAERDSDGDVRVVVIQREGAGTQSALAEDSRTERPAERLVRKSLGRLERSFRRIDGDVIKVPPERLAESCARNWRPTRTSRPPPPTCGISGSPARWSRGGSRAYTPTR